MVRGRATGWLQAAGVLLLAVSQSMAGFPPPAVAAPAMRIGLGSGEDRLVVLEAAGGLRLVDAATGNAPWKDLFQGPTRVVLLGAGEVRTIFRVQVGTFTSEEVAETLAARLGRELHEQTDVHHDSQRRLYRVRVGTLDQRTAAAALASRLVAMGYADAWVARETVGYSDDGRLRIVDQNYLEQTLELRRLVAFPAGRGLVKVNQRHYRGIIEIFIDDGGRLRVVNVVNLEDYLKGVVPDEMGPGVYPEPEALMAQAVAARTYAVRNRGQYADNGFDICDSPRCQVYGGADSEHSMSDQAVAGTRGMVVTSEGELANTLFTSTCGGHTEDVENVFPEDSEPYLKGVVCTPERDERRQVVSYLDGRHDLAYLSRAPDLARGIARLVVQGVVESAFITAEGMDQALGAERWQDWLQRLAPHLGREPLPRKDLSGGVRRGRMARDLVDLMGWQERLERLFQMADAAVVLGLAPGDPLPRKVREGGGPQLALLTRDSLIPFTMVVGPAVWSDEVRAVEALTVLARLAERYVDEPVTRLRVATTSGGKLESEEGESLELAEDLFLFGATERGPVPVGRLALTRHEPVLVHLNSAGRIDYLEATRPFRSLSDDRFSTRHHWETSISRKDLSRKLGRGLDFGDLLDLEVVRRGVSGRVAEMKVMGSKGTATLRGFDIRVALGLMETLFTVDRQHGPDGRVRTFTFAGKGWGHGVGLCQVGAFGMAVRGLNHREILHHYYTGVDLVLLAEHPELLAAKAEP
ncbi:MAG: SpoIID/LytB domain-containing protein [Acidobacteria bacterium]|nr:MAG: SpoIID/LytB domain-containing protein [Acidobacteriota bacterium]